MSEETEPATELVHQPDEAAPREGSAFWSATGRFFGTVGTAIGHAAVKTGQSAVAAYQSVDPDARKHLAQLPVMGLSMLGPRDATVEPLPGDGHRPIILVHGLASHPGNFLALRQYLALKGRKRVYAIDFGSAENMDLMAAMLRDFVATVVERNELDDEAQVDIVAHSMGGLEPHWAPSRDAHPVGSSIPTIRRAEGMGQHGVQVWYWLHPKTTVQGMRRGPAESPRRHEGGLGEAPLLPLCAVSRDPQSLEARRGLSSGAPRHPVQPGEQPVEDRGAERQARRHADGKRDDAPHAAQHPRRFRGHRRPPPAAWLCPTGCARTR